VHLVQSFRFVECPAVHRFISYLNPKVDNKTIPRKSTLTDAVNSKVANLDDITITLIQVCPHFSFLVSLSDVP